MNIVKSSFLLRPSALRWALRSHSSTIGHPLVVHHVFQNFGRTFEAEPKRGHKNFGHRPKSLPRATKIYYIFTVTAMFICLIDWHK